MPEPRLEIEGLDGRYGTAHVLFGVTLTVGVGETVALLGRNGAGKSTLLKAVARVEVETTGAVRLHGQDLTRLMPHRVARLGVQLVPEDRRVLGSLTVQENLELGRHAAAPDRPAPSLDEVVALFPTLAPLLGRRGRELSGGEQQLVAIARAMMGRPRLLLADEPSEGLAPAIVRQVGEVLSALRAQGDLSILLAEQNARFALDLCDRVYVIDGGRIVFGGRPEELRGESELERRYLAL
jgi:ABC-type branched-subunit amino acid transport system ATPase component